VFSLAANSPPSLPPRAEFGIRLGQTVSLFFGTLFRDPARDPLSTTPLTTPPFGVSSPPNFIPLDCLPLAYRSSVPFGVPPYPVCPVVGPPLPFMEHAQRFPPRNAPDRCGVFLSDLEKTPPCRLLADSDSSFKPFCRFFHQVFPSLIFPPPSSLGKSSALSLLKLPRFSTLNSEYAPTRPGFSPFPVS